MDYYYENENFQGMIEVERNRIKDRILKEYVTLRKQKGLTQQDVADRTGLIRTNVVRIEGGKNVPTIELLLKLAAAVDMDLEVRLVERGTRAEEA